jgi:hypothetical protein
MKTPREFLLEQHQAARPKLDAIRAQVVAGIAPARARGGSWRWHLGALSAAWAVVLLLNVDRSPGPRAARPQEKAATSQEIRASLRERRLLLLELTDTPAPGSPAVPGRRSEMEPQETEV